jgi:hypothetical protein
MTEPVDYDYLHELELVTFRIQSPRPVRALAAFLRALGFTLHEDVLSLDRKGNMPPWQHKSVVEVKILKDGKEVFDLDAHWNVLNLEYLLAWLPAECIDVFVDCVFQVARWLGSPATHRGVQVTERELRDSLNGFCRELEDRVGESVGSEGLAILIQSTYPRPTPKGNQRETTGNDGTVYRGSCE